MEAEQTECKKVVEEFIGSTDVSLYGVREIAMAIFEKNPNFTVTEITLAVISVTGKSLR